MAPKGDFEVSAEDLKELMKFRAEEGLKKVKDSYGSVEELCKKLKTNPQQGLSGDEEDLRNRTEIFGKNEIPRKPPKTFIRLLWEALQDATLIILIIAAVISLALSFYHPNTEKKASGVKSDNSTENNSTVTNLNITTTVASTTGGSQKSSEMDNQYEWIEGVAILVSVAIVIFVTAFNDYSKEKQFRALQAKLEKAHIFSVIRKNQAITINDKELVVGDICQIKYGDLLPADGILIQGSELKIDESALTGESDQVEKSVNEDPMLLSGTHVMEGGGKMVVTAVGLNSQNGMIMSLIGLGQEEEAGEGGDKKKGKSVKGKEKGKPIEMVNLKDSKQQNDKKGKNKNVEGKNNNKLEDENLDQEEPKKKDKPKKHQSVLQIKLAKMAMQIGKGGFAIAILTVVILVTRYCIENYGIEKKGFVTEDIQHFVKYFIIGVTVLVVAVPEGLPLAVTLSLAYSVKKMMVDNNLVRHLDACETMGNATRICSDKTGTLTMNEMHVVQSYIALKHVKEVPKWDDIPENVRELLAQSIAVNSSYSTQIVPAGEKKADPENQPSRQDSKKGATIDDKDAKGKKTKQQGNKTECGLLEFLIDMGQDYQKIRNDYPDDQFEKVYTFNSERKSMSTVIKVKGKDGGYHLYSKGASEIILKRCVKILGEDGKAKDFSDSDKEKVTKEIIESMAGDGLRTICLAYREFKSGQKWDNEKEVTTGLTCIAIVGIEDPVRPEVPEAIKKCHTAGITVTMVTGDNINTAKAIAKNCGILKADDKDAIVMEGREFTEKILDSRGNVKQAELDKIWPKLRVLARAQPIDKYHLVGGIIDSKLAQEMRQVVAVTGDGTNDGPALKKADVGFAMGITGTDVAKEAADIILTDDNFNSIVNAVKWGRNVYDSITKFLQFQLTVNVVAVVLAVTGACFIRDSPLKAVQMLWVNLIMDTLASLALATELPSDELLKRKPYGRTEPLISRTMARNIIGNAFYQLVVVFVLLFAGEEIFHLEKRTPGTISIKPTQHFTIIFNTFVMMTLFNEINSRKIHSEMNVFKGLFQNWIFVIIWIGTFVSQILIIQFGGYAFQTAELDIQQWAACVGLGAFILIWNFMINRIPVSWLPACPKCFDRKKGKMDAETGAMLEPEEEEEEESVPELTRGRLWLRGVSRVENQMQVIRAFQDAAGVQRSRSVSRYSLGMRKGLSQESGDPPSVDHVVELSYEK